jgi:hypothetical protein
MERDRKRKSEREREKRTREEGFLPGARRSS